MRYVLILLISFLFYACTGDSPFDYFEEDAIEIEREKEIEKCYEKMEDIYVRYDQFCCSNYNILCYSSSSINRTKLEIYAEKYNSTCCNNCYKDFYTYECKYCTDKCYDAYGKYLCGATTTEKTMKFTLTYYKQLKKMDGRNLTDGDPEISFTINFIKSNKSKVEKKTGVLLKLNDTGFWSGTESVLFTVPATTDTIEVCPYLLEIDALSDDKEYNSGYCYRKAQLSSLSDYEVVYQSDKNATYFDLKWEWYLY